MFMEQHFFCCRLYFAGQCVAVVYASVAIRPVAYH